MDEIRLAIDKELDKFNVLSRDELLKLSNEDYMNYLKLKKLKDIIN